MDTVNVKTWALLAIVLLFLILLPGINHGLWRPDEPRVAGTCAEMARTYDFVVPHFNGEPFLEKPPLYYAVAALSGLTFGIDQDIPYRLASLLFAVLTILTTYFMISRREGVILGIVAGGILASSWEIFMLSRWIQVDIALVFGVTLAMYAYLRLMDSHRIRDSIILGFALGIAFMAKGMVGPAIVAAAIITDIVRRWDFKILWRIRPFLIITCMIVIILPWVIALWNRGGWPFVREIIVVNNLMRFTGAVEGAALGHQHGPFYYLGSFPGYILPWTLIFIPAIISSFRKFKDDPYISWFIGPFILLTISSTKRGIYLTPMFPAIASMIAVWLGKSPRMKWENILVKITWGIAIVGSIVPFAGIFLGQPILGISMGILAVSGLAALTRGKVKEREAVSLVLVVCLALSAVTMIYYPYEKPRKDYLSFSRQALVVAGNKEIVVLAPDEILEGVLPMITGKVCKVVNSPSDINKEGIYIWADRRDQVLKELIRQHAKVEILYERQVDHFGNKTARLAHIVPKTNGGTGEPIIKSGKASMAPSGG